MKLPKTLHEQVEALPKVTARNRERAREWLEQIELPHQTRVERLTALLDEVDADHDEAERRAGMLKAVHGALIDAGLTPGDIGHCEVDMVRRLTRERDEARAEVERLLADVRHVIAEVDRKHDGADSWCFVRDEILAKLRKLPARAAQRGGE